MAHIVLHHCINCKYGDCIEVCPVDCFYEGENMVAIDPDACIDCGVCIPECPLDAIKHFESCDENDEEAKEWLTKNHEAVHKYKWPNITTKIGPMPEAEKHSKMQNKGKLFSTKPAPTSD